MNEALNVFNELLFLCGTSPNPASNFKGLVDGDKWCLCVSRWIEAIKAGVAPTIILKATHLKTLKYISLEALMNFAYTTPLI